jgi:uncharacterized protein (TIGR03067 family)
MLAGVPFRHQRQPVNQANAERRWSMIRVALRLAVAGLVGLTAGFASVSADPPKEVEQPSGGLAGSWKVVSLERDGKEIGEGLKGAKWVFTDTTLTARFPGEGEAKFTYETHTVDNKVGTIDLEVVESARDGGPRKRVYPGIYSVEGNTLKICYASTGKPSPKEFATKVGSGNTLVVLKR